MKIQFSNVIELSSCLGKRLELNRFNRVTSFLVFRYFELKLFTCEKKTEVDFINTALKGFGMLI